MKDKPKYIIMYNNEKTRKVTKYRQMPAPDKRFTSYLCPRKKLDSIFNKCCIFVENRKRVVSE